MALTLTILLSLLSAAILAGRVYEILNLTDMETGLFYFKGIVFNPYILLIFAIITVCCGIIIFGDSKKAKPYYSKSSKYTAIIAGVALVVAGAMNMQTDKVSLFFIFGGLALLIMGITSLGKKPKDYLILVLFLLFAAGLCMDVIVFDVYSIYNTAFLKKSLSHLTIIIFVLMVIKNVYAPNRYTRMLLYITGILAFVFCSIMSIAQIICFVVLKQSFQPQLITEIATALFGLYAFDNAVSAVPPKKADSKTTEKTQDTDAVNAETEKTEETESVKIEEQENITAQTEEESDYCQTEDNSAEEVQTEQKAVQEDAEKDMFNLLFSEESEKTEAVKQEKPVAERTVRSFKKVGTPKYDESSAHYDMLKSMFMGEDTSEYDINSVLQEEHQLQTETSVAFDSTISSVNTAEVLILESTKNEPKTLPKKPDGKIKFVAEGTKNTKAKSDGKKVVYKKPK